MNDPKGGVAKVTCPTFEAMGQIPMFHRTYFLFRQSNLLMLNKLICEKITSDVILVTACMDRNYKVVPGPNRLKILVHIFPTKVTPW